jgi:hypothetical protein
LRHEPQSAYFSIRVTAHIATSGEHNKTQHLSAAIFGGLIHRLPAVRLAGKLVPDPTELNPESTVCPACQKLICTPATPFSSKKSENPYNLCAALSQRIRIKGVNLSCCGDIMLAVAGESQELAG